MKLLLVFSILLSSLFSKEHYILSTDIKEPSDCLVPNPVLESIMSVERSLDREIGYPFIIRINRKKEIKKAHRVLKGMYYTVTKRDKAVIDCKSTNNCAKITKKLVSSKIKNIDLGAFGLNYYWREGWRYNPRTFFINNKASLITCKYLHELNNEFGWSWRTIGNYHNRHKKRNDLYVKRLKRYIEKKGYSSEI